jgi:F420-dependent oxidoreductase-like protein
MRLGVNLAYDAPVVTAQAAERLGFAMALAPEGYRSDAATVLGLVAGHTKRIALASGVFQIPARTPGIMALTAATLDTLSHGRFRLGLGVSNADVSEGWYGVPFAKPLVRTREYVDVVRMALRRERVSYCGEHFRLPLSAPGEMLELRTTPVHENLPIYLAAVGPQSLRLAGEIADGWLGVFSSPTRVAQCLERIRDGRQSTGRGLEGYEVICSVPLVLGPDPHACAEPVRAHVAHFLAMGDPRRNTYLALAERLGYGAEARRVHELARIGDFAAAAATIPFDLVDEVALLGPEDRVADRMRRYAEAGVTILALSPSGPPQQRAELLAVAARIAANLQATDRHGDELAP